MPGGGQSYTPAVLTHSQGGTGSWVPFRPLAMTKGSAWEGHERKTPPSTRPLPAARRRVKQTPPRVKQSLFEQVPFSG